ncbi:MAG: peptide chain release factor 2 [Dehalococcoidia bacterium]|nr:peptide chain release factor 2 [Dehalococcoidia bacterium]
MEDLKERLEVLHQRVSDNMVRLDLAGQQVEASRLEEESSKEDFWADPDVAQKVMRRLSLLKETIRTWRGLESQSGDLLGLIELASADGDDAMLGEIEEETLQIESQLREVEFQLFVQGEYDNKNAIVAIHAGAGGTESQDWVQMLLRMYVRWAERRRFGHEVLDLTQGEEAGIKSVVAQLTGPYAYGYLKAERGVHRLVRISPFDAAHRRHTSFALVEVMPEVDDAPEISLGPDDLKIDVFRASGAGGQNVQKTSTAVRITHIPTGLVVSCQNERSQFQNKETALKILRARLMERELEKKEEEWARLKGQHVAAGWGNQIRSYVLQPYTLVKDHRTGYETTNPSAVLEGDLDDFMEQYLRSILENRG